jgi:putative ABC transport system permease protein
VLTTIQFTIAIALIIVLVFIKQQYNYAVNYSSGMQKENIVYLSTYQMNNLKDVPVLSAELKRNPLIPDCTLSSCIPNETGSVRTRAFENTQILFANWFVDSNFLPFFGIPVIEGVDFPNSTSSSAQQIIVNKEFVKASGSPDITGKEIDGMEIIGVVNDINFQSLHNAMMPMGFVVEKSIEWHPYWLYIKITGNELPQTIAYIESVWKNFSNRPLVLTFLDTHWENLYKKEKGLADLLTMNGIATILIAIMGVYGLIVFSIRQKEKEIALRKISGASLKDILLLLNRGVVIQLLIAFVVATPIAYYITIRWLETFAYKISIHWWVFVLCWLFMCIIIITLICLQTYKAAVKNPVEALKTE